MSVRKSLIEKMIEQDKRSYASLSRQQIIDLIDKAFESKEARYSEVQQFAQDLLSSYAGKVVDAACGLLPDLKEPDMRAAVTGVLIRACQSGEFDSLKTITSECDHLFSAIRGRMAERISYIISEARAEAAAAPLMLETPTPEKPAE